MARDAAARDFGTLAEEPRLSVEREDDALSMGGAINDAGVASNASLLSAVVGGADWGRASSSAKFVVYSEGVSGRLEARAMDKIFLYIIRAQWASLAASRRAPVKSIRNKEV